MNDDDVRALDEATAIRGPVPGSEHSEADPFAGLWRTLADAGRWFDTAPPPRRWLLKHGNEGALPMGKVGMLVAGGGNGKTMALVQLALAVALGKQWLDTFEVPDEGQGRVLIALGEEDAEEVQRRFYRAAEAMGLTHEERSRAAGLIVALPLAGKPVALTAKNDAGNIAETEALDWLRRHLQNETWSLVILDPLSRFAGDDTERDNAAATRLVQAIETLVKGGDGPTVLLAHHSSKSSLSEGTANARGSSALTDGCRWVAAMNKAGEGAILSLSKTNYSKPWPDVFLSWAQNGALGKATDAQAEAMREAVREARRKARQEAMREARNAAAQTGGRPAGKVTAPKPAAARKPAQAFDEEGILDD